MRSGTDSLYAAAQMLRGLPEERTEAVAPLIEEMQDEICRLCEREKTTPAVRTSGLSARKSYSDVCAAG